MADRRRTGIWTVVIVLAGLTAAFLFQRREGSPESEDVAVREVAGKPGRYETLLSVVGTDARLEAVARSKSHARRMFQQAVEQMRMVELRMSTYRRESEVSRLNATGSQHPVELSEHTLRVLRKAVEMSKLTGGAFDVTYAPLRTLWRRAQQEGRLPGADAIEEALAAVGHTKLIFEESRVGFAVPGMEVDLGGVAKGYAVDLATEALQAGGAEAGFVDIGGDLRFFGLPAPGQRWRVAVRSPPGVQETFTLSVPACAVTTSGDYARSFQVGDRRLSHIVDPRTGWPVANMPSVTLVAPDATTADALATAVSVMGPEEGLKLVDSLPEVECMIMARGQDDIVRTHMSQGFASLLEGP
ncbi:MAG: FAD:protein FMN transferase [Candidatus Brocadiae bacterium]|nr:FAD:protein FMN transferase [Candidatus Brocadiia bacterium]